MAVKIRLARGGAKKSPYYRIVVANSTAPRDGDFIEKIGTYNPMLKKDDKSRVSLNKERAELWLSRGAMPTERVINFMLSAGVSLPETIVKKVEIKKKAQVQRPSRKEQKAASK